MKENTETQLPVPEYRRDSQPVLIDAKDIGVRRDGRWLVRGVDLSLSAGEIVTLVGPNGSGKSTTAKMIIGVLKPDAGTVVRSPDLKIGYMPQKFAVDQTLPLTVNRLMTLTGPSTPAEIERALNAVAIPHLAHSAVQSLSGGELQRALLARAILRKPDLLVLDEPVQGVDFSGEVALYNLIRDIRDQTGCGILLISHDLHVVMAQTDSVVCLNGHVCCHGSPESVVANPEYIKLFGRRAAETLAIYRHDHDHTHLPDGRIMSSDGSVIDGHDHEDHTHGNHDHVR